MRGCRSQSRILRLRRIFRRDLKLKVSEETELVDADSAEGWFARRKSQDLPQVQRLGHAPGI
jgi:hypothetical protein